MTYVITYSNLYNQPENLGWRVWYCVKSPLNRKLVEKNWWAFILWLYKYKNICYKIYQEVIKTSWIRNNIKNSAGLAQLEERLSYTENVGSSNLSSCTMEECNSWKAINHYILSPSERWQSWSNAPDLKSDVDEICHRGFESYSLRQQIVKNVVVDVVKRFKAS